jgi:hypothetical protein
LPIKRDNFYRASIGHNGKRFSAGCYKLGADAAFVYDFVLRHLTATNLINKKSSRKRSINFDTDAEYHKARSQELSEKGIEQADEDYLSAVTSKAQQYAASIASKIQATEIAGAETEPGARSFETCNKEVEGIPAPPNSSADDSAIRADPAPTIGKKPQSSSRYTGVSYIKQSKSYLARVTVKGKARHLGEYHLETDAAFAYDQAVTVFSKGALLSRVLNTNFASSEEYETAREQEIKRCNGVDAYGKKFVSIAEVTSKVQRYVDNIISNIDALGIDTSGTRGDAASIASKIQATEMAGTETEPGSDADKNEGASNIGILIHDIGGTPSLLESFADNQQSGTAPIAQNAPKSNRFIGVSYSKRQKNYQTRICYDGKGLFAGCYKLEANAAFVYDYVMRRLTAVNLMNKSGRQSINFETNAEYHKARVEELRKMGIEGTETDEHYLSAITSKAQRYAASIASKVQVVTTNAGAETEPGARSFESCNKEVEGIPVPPNSSADNSAIRADPAPTIEKKPPPSSRYTGVSYIKQSKSYLARVTVKGKKRSLGYYRLEKDAAFAYDQAVTMFSKAALLTRILDTNFASSKEYEIARAQEIESCNGVDAYGKKFVSIVEVNFKAQQCATNIINKIEGERAIEHTTTSHNGEPDHDKMVHSACIEANIMAEVGGTTYNSPCSRSNPALFDKQAPETSVASAVTLHAEGVDEGAKVRQYINALIKQAGSESTPDREENNAIKEQEADGTSLISHTAGDGFSTSTKKEKKARKRERKKERRARKRERKLEKEGKSRYRNVSFKTRVGKYEAKILFNKNTTYYLGQYILSADAAFAADQALRFQEGDDATTNFKTKSDYERARSDEIEASEVEIEVVGSLEDVSLRIHGYLAKFKAKYLSSKKKPKEVKKNHAAEVAGECMPPA